MSRQQAPRRKVIDVIRVGGYGNTWWVHTLSCGHVQRRKRKAPAPSMGCEMCLDGLPEMADPEEPVVVRDLISLRADVARKLGVEFDAVDAFPFFGGIKVEVLFDELA